MDIQTIKFQATDRAATEIETGCLVIGVFSDRPAREQLPEIDKATDSLLTEMAEEGELALGAGKTLMIHHPRGIKARRLLVTGLGKAGRFDDSAFVRSAIARAISFGGAAPTPPSGQRPCVAQKP